MLDHANPGDGDFDVDAKEFHAVLAVAGNRRLMEVALAHGGLSRVAAAQSRIADVLQESDVALTAYTNAEGLVDVRVQSQLLIIRSAAFSAAGEISTAREWAAKALANALAFDDPASTAVSTARNALAVLLVAPEVTPAVTVKK